MYGGVRQSNTDAKQGYAVTYRASSARLAIRVAIVITELSDIIAKSPAHSCLASVITF